MRGAWPGRLDVELLVEPTARTTAQNAARSLRLLLEREIGRATVVCAAHHALRVRYFFGALYERYGVACEVQPGRWSFSPGPLVHELGALTVMRRQRAAALSELRTAVRA